MSESSVHRFIIAVADLIVARGEGVIDKVITYRALGELLLKAADKAEEDAQAGRRLLTTHSEKGDVR